ncbi:CHAD domain-containing protein [Pseudomonas sp. 2FG]|uniref:CHAD domain-containing protein n=1 Tax=Pseudomonas sp. 2FG TaxID=2502191 RepID=UPI0010F8ACA0|nr:CHAD domain-containing protein [Pseudomonas sp. 2FG]
MAGFVDALIAQVLRLAINLQACRARLGARTDGEVLHDLRIALRKLRSLLRPLRGLLENDPLEPAAAALGQLSGPLRDTEVLLAELQAHAVSSQLDARRQALDAGYTALLASAELQQLFRALDVWPELFRQAQADAALRGLARRVQRYLARQRRRLGAALRAPDHDLHRTRLLIKRMRYGAEAYPQQAAVSSLAALALKAAQTALGDWHDHLQWLARAEREPDLAPRVAEWRQALAAAEQLADRALLPLQKYFPGR